MTPVLPNRLVPAVAADALSTRSLTDMLAAPAAGALTVPGVGHVKIGRRPITDSAAPGAAPAAGLPDHVVDVSRPVLRWRWTSVLLLPFELLLVAWSVPVVILMVAIPIALGIALVLRVARFASGYF
jgi:hypothetical protein